MNYLLYDKLPKEKKSLITSLQNEEKEINFRLSELFISYQKKYIFNIIII